MAQHAEATHAHTNRLANETSPYLLQHAHNPVDWYPWGEEALKCARTENKPIFLSIGYSACHWCHVMERESFENEGIADIMNRYFVNIKVDREERPDLDEIYMSAVQAMTGSGGWPMSVWLTPELKPFYGGTYYPPEDKYGRPGFPTVLMRIGEMWETNREELVASSEKLTKHMRQILAGTIGAGGALEPALLHSAVDELIQTFDRAHGGFGPAPKFPSAPSIQLLLRHAARTGDESALDAATFTLDAMAQGGIYDHLGGGFARYAVDAEWLVPHFEKMLYDNAQLASVYIEAWQLTKKPLYRRVVEETLDYVLRDMTDESGGFYSAEDADSEGEEGKFYIWTYDEIQQHLGAQEGELFAAYYNVKPGGNFSSHEAYHAGQNILHMDRAPVEIAEERGMSEDDLRGKIAEMRDKLLAVRNDRVRPGLDDKILSAWNGLMISAFAQAAAAFDNDRYRKAAVNAADFVLNEMSDEKGQLLRTHREGESRLPGYLEDYAYNIPALIDLYEASFDLKWLRQADRLAQIMIEKFWDDESDSLYFTSDDHANLIVRTRPTYDGATPSGNSMAALGLLRLAKLLDKSDYYVKAEKLMQGNRDYLARAPRGFLKMLVAADFYLYPPKEIAIVGPEDAPGTEALRDALFEAFIPNKVVALLDPNAGNREEIEQAIPLLSNKKTINGQPAAYVCENFACNVPVADSAAMLEQLTVQQGEA